MAKKDLNRQKNRKKTSLTTQIHSKLTIEDIYSWIEYGFDELKLKKNIIQKAFKSCGYYENQEINEMHELSRNFEEMKIEEDENIGIPIEDDEEDEVSSDIEEVAREDRMIIE